MREKCETVESSWDGVAARWRAHFVNKLQDLYGLPEEEAGTKADAWLGWLKQRTDPKPQRLLAPEIVAKVRRGPGSRSLNSRRLRPGKSRSSSAASS
jgi:hypothetical protein